MGRFVVNMSRHNMLWIIVTLILCLVPAVLLNDHFAARRAVGIEANRAQVSAGLLASGFRRELEKFRLASIVLAQDPDAVDALRVPSAAALQQLNLKLESLAKETSAAAIYLMDKDGLTRAASNWRSPTRTRRRGRASAPALRNRRPRSSRKAALQALQSARKA